MRIIAHIDMDAFFAAVEERENPQYKGLGIVVGADPKEGRGRGVVSTANYQARKYGIHSALPISSAWRFAEAARSRGEPRTVFLPVNMDYYSQVSGRIFGIIKKYVPVVEQTSVDEGFLEIKIKSQKSKIVESSLIVEKEYIEAVEVISSIKREIFENERLTCKVGIGPNKLVAKIATSKAKPDSVSIIYPQYVQKFLDPLSVGDIPGIGPRTEEVLNKKNIFTISDLRKVLREDLRVWFGKWGEMMYEKARGLDDSLLVIGRKAKSISEQETFDKDTLSAAILIPKIEELAGRVGERMKGEGVEKFKTVTITVRFADFTTRSRAHSLNDFISDGSMIKKEAMKLFFPFLDRRENPKKKFIRLLGVGIENFESSDEEIRKRSQESLF